MTEDEIVETTETVVVLDEPVDVVLVEVADNRNFMHTAFSDYTVTEGLLLLILLFMVIKFIINLLREGFSWLLS